MLLLSFQERNTKFGQKLTYIKSRALTRVTNQEIKR
jgi:hypothetical protein